MDGGMGRDRAARRHTAGLRGLSGPAQSVNTNEAPVQWRRRPAISSPGDPAAERRAMTVSSQTKQVGGPPPAGSSFARRTASGAAPIDPAVASLEFKPGTVVGDFELVKRLGIGGMGAVWQAQQRSLQRPVALKLIRPEFLDAQTIELFEREARAGGRLRHAGIVTVYAAGEVGGVHFIAQELVEGGHNLAVALSELRGLDAPPPDYSREVAGLVAGVADALQVAHDA